MRLIIVYMASLLAGCDGITFGAPVFLPPMVDGVSICYGDATTVQTCQATEVRLCNSKSEPKTVRVSAKRRLPDDGTVSTYNVPGNASSKNGPYLGTSEYMDGYCRSYFYTLLPN